jgi:hypothetical protein
MLNTIVGRRGANGCSWTVDGEPVELGPSLAVRNHSPTGFEWGYGGSGPAQSALAILLHILGTPERPPGPEEEWSEEDWANAQWPGGDAERVYQEFKWKFIAPLPRDVTEVSFELDVREWVALQLAERRWI